MFLKGRGREKSKRVEGSNTIFLNKYVFFQHLLFLAVAIIASTAVTLGIAANSNPHLSLMYICI